MDKKLKESNIEKPRERINQFIIECLFNKYFEEATNNKAVFKKEKVVVGDCS